MLHTITFSDFLENEIRRDIESGLMPLFEDTIEEEIQAAKESVSGTAHYWERMKTRFERLEKDGKITDLIINPYYSITYTAIMPSTR